MSTQTMKLFIEQLRLANTRIVTLVGGGISRASPASFPLSHEIIEAILNSAIEQTDLNSILIKRLKDSLKQTALPLEYFSQIASQVFGKEFVELFPKFVHPTARPNSFHRFLAVASSKGLLEAIITPNFDEFIEEAMKSLGMCQSQARRLASNANNLTPNIFPVRYYRIISSVEDFANLKKFSNLNTTDNPGDTIPIIKLHGTLSIPKSITTSVESYQSWFMREKKDTVDFFVRQRPLTWFFAGYSGRDEIFSWLHPPTAFFDNVPLFHKVFWLMKKAEFVWRYTQILTPLFRIIRCSIRFAFILPLPQTTLLR